MKTLEGEGKIIIDRNITATCTSSTGEVGSQLGRAGRGGAGRLKGIRGR